MALRQAPADPADYIYRQVKQFPAAPPMIGTYLPLSKKVDLWPIRGNDIIRIKENELMNIKEDNLKKAQVEMSLIKKDKMNAKQYSEMSNAEKLRWEVLQKIEKLEGDHEKIEDWNMTPEMQ